jgi:hypothetical protein
MTATAKKRKRDELEDLAFSIPARAERLWHEVKFPILWACAAVISLSLLVSFSVTRKGGERLAMLPYEMQDVLQKRAPGSSLTAALDKHFGQYRNEAARLATTRSNFEQRIAQLEENYGDITGSLPKRASVPAPAVAPVAPQLQKTAATDEASNGAITITTRSQFGIDLGTDQTMSALRTRWIKLMEQFGMIMTGYEPVISASDTETGVVLHLVVGPFSNAQDAAQACMKLRAAGLASCAPVPYDGQSLALR